MYNHDTEEKLARLAGDIMFGEEYTGLLERIYSERDTIAEFESNPKYFLMRHGIDIPENIDVVIHHPGTLGRPARVDFHWGESVEKARATMRAARQNFRKLARVACDTLFSSEMKQLMQTIQSSPDALAEFASNPKAYAAAHHVIIQDDINVVVNLDDPKDPKIELHFGAPPGTSKMSGCYYCKGDACCCVECAYWW